MAHVKVVSPHQNGLDDRSVPMVMIGYEDSSKAYRTYDPVARRVHVTRDVVFEESKHLNWSSQSKNDELHSGDEIFSVFYPTTEPTITAKEGDQQLPQSMAEPGTSVAMDEPSLSTETASAGMPVSVGEPASRQ